MSMTICYSDPAMTFEEAVGVLTLTLVSDHAEHLPAHVEEAIKDAVQPQHRVCHDDARLCPHCTLDAIMRELFDAKQLPVM